MLHPRVVEVPSFPRELALWGDAVAVLTHRGVHLYDRELELRETLDFEAQAPRLCALRDGRAVVFDELGWSLRVGARGEGLSLVEEARFLAVAPTEEGFLAVGRERAQLDRKGKRSAVTLPWRPLEARAWGEKVVLFGDQRVGLLDARGEVLDRETPAQRSEHLALGEHFVVGCERELLVFERAFRRVAAVPAAEKRLVLALGEGFALVEGESFTLWHPKETHHWRAPSRVDAVVALGERLLVGFAGRPEALWLDAKGNASDTLTLPAPLREGWPLGEGFALQVEEDPSLWFWREGAALERLEHDAEPDLVRALGGELYASEGSLLSRWSCRASGPERARVQSALPLHVPLMVDGQRVVLHEAGFRAMRGRGAGANVTVPPDARGRLALGAEEARSLVDAMCARSASGPLLSLDLRDGAAAREALRERTVAELAPVQERAVRAWGTLTPSQRLAVEVTRQAFLEELSGALGVSARSLFAALQGGRFPLEPPQALPGFDYLGSFEVAGPLTISDPCYLGRREGTKGLSLSLHAQGRPGLWHGFANTRSVGRWTGLTGKLLVVHAAGFALPATEELGVIGVDAGVAGVFLPGKKPQAEWLVEDGLIPGGGGVWARSGMGDGGYAVRVARLDGRVVRIVLDFLEEEGPDEVLAAPAQARRYAPSERFEVGEALEHAKFGSGVVVSVGPPGRIEVLFADGRRTLVHDQR